MTRNLLRISSLVLLIMCCFLLDVNARQFHVTVSGRADGDGSVLKPWNLTKGLTATAEVKGGDTLMIHGGIYIGNFSSSLAGEQNRNVVVMNYNNEKVVLDGNTGVNNSSALIINGRYTTFKNLHVTNSNTSRLSSSDSNNPTDIIRSDGVNVFGANIKCINLVIYDNLGIGMGLWSTSIDAEIYGCILYNNGWSGPGRGLGHNMYMQNQTGTKLIQDCIIFNAASQGINVYTEGGSIKGFSFEGNTFFNNGSLGRLQLERNLLVGGGQPAGRIIIRDNLFYHSSNKSGFTSKANLQLGYGVANEDAVIENNYILGGNAPFYEIYGWNKLTVRNNTIIGFSANSNIINAFLTNDISQFVWDQNNYYQGVFNGLAFNTWKSTYSFDANSSYVNGLPSKNQIFVRSSKYEAGRGHVAILNWEKLSEVSVDLSSVLSSGAEFRVYDVQNLAGQPVLSGKWDGGAVRFPMNLTAMTAPNGNIPTKPPHTGIEFGSYLVLSNSIPNPLPVETDSVFQLKKLYPNPTADIVMIEFNSDNARDVVVNIFDLSGHKIHNELFGAQKGENKLLLNLSKYSSGLYVIELKSGSQSVTYKVLKTSHIVEARQSEDSIN